MKVTQVDDLWIGDWLLLLSSKKVGRFEGVSKSGKIRVRVNDKIILTHPTNIQLTEDPAQKEENFNLYENPKPSPKKFEDRKIDLHIEVLAPHLLNQPPQRILLRQLDALKDFIDYATQHYWSSAEIIHGKGEGVLRHEVHHICELDERVTSFISINEGGATLIYFR